MADLLPPVVAKLGANITDYQAGLAKAKAEMAEFAGVTKTKGDEVGESFKSVGSMATTGLAVAGAALIAFGVHSASTFEQAGRETLKLTRYTGDTAENMSKLRYAAQQSGVGVDQLTNGMKFLSRAMVGTGSAHDALVNLGVATTDAQGHLRSVNDVLLDTADKFEHMQNGAEKTAEAVKIFGRAGADLLPMLNKGRDGLVALEAEAQKYGMVLTGDNLNAVKESIQAHRQFDAAMQGLQISIGQHVLPVLTSLTEFFTKLPGPIKDAIGPVTIFGAAGLALVAIGSKVVGVLSPVVSVVKKVATSMIEATAAEEGFAAKLEASGAAAGLVFTAAAVGIGVYISKLQDVKSKGDDLDKQWASQDLSMSWDHLNESLSSTQQITQKMRDEGHSDFWFWDRNAADAAGDAAQKAADHKQHLIDVTNGLASATGISTEDAWNWVRGQEAAGNTIGSTAGAVAGYTGKIQDEGLSEQEAAAAVKEHDQSLKDLQDTMHASLDPLFAVQKAQKDVNTAQLDAYAATVQYGGGSVQAQEATDKLTQAGEQLYTAMLDVQKGGQSAASGAQATTDSLNLLVSQGILTSTQAQDVANRLGVVRDQAYSIPSDVHTTVTADTSQAMNALGALSGQISKLLPFMGSMLQAHVPGHAAGGSVDEGWFIVGEQGPELGHKSGSSVEIFSNSDSNRMLSGGHPASSQPIQINLFMDNRKVAEAIIDPLIEREKALR